MPVRRLPDLTPERVARLQTALLANADQLRIASLAVLELGQVALARSLAILALEESGKAIAIHRRRKLIVHLPEGEPFRCEWLDMLWASHEKKLLEVYGFLVDEEYWLDVEPPDPDVNAAALGSIRAWSKRQDRSKERGLYVELNRLGDALAPRDLADEEPLLDVLSQVHQIGWQLRLGEHIEGKRQDEQERGVPASDDADALFPDDPGADPAIRQALRDLRESARDGSPGTPLNNAGYRVSASARDGNPFRAMGAVGYEAETRELLRLMDAVANEQDRSPRE